MMACGTGKTFTSLRIAEDLVGQGGTVLFLVPWIQLLSQSLREWMANRETDIRPFAVCSDVRVGRKVADDGDLSTIDLTEPATTDATTLAQRMASGRRATPRMTVVRHLSVHRGRHPGAGRTQPDGLRRGHLR